MTRPVRGTPGTLVWLAGQAFRVALAACAVALLAAGCHREIGPTPGSAEDLAAYLRGVAGADEATRRDAVAGWVLDEAAWRRIVVDPYRDVWRDYVAAFDRARPALVARLAAHGAITTRRHYAGDPRLTRAQGRLRWAVPVQYPSMVAELGGAPIDTVFVYDGARWRALAGLDDVVLARARALDPACAALLARAGRIGHCGEVGWMIADAALRTQRARFAHACKLAASLCGNEAP